jgi:MFS family permease
LNRRLGGPQSRSGRGGEEKNSYPPPGIESQNPETVILEFRVSVSGSIAFICQPIGSLMSSFIVEFFGRKWSMFLVNIPFLAGWLVYSFSASISMLFAANIILGLGIGFMEAPIMTYLSETCQPQLRALITSFPGASTHPEINPSSGIYM